MSVRGAPKFIVPFADRSPPRVNPFPAVSVVLLGTNPVKACVSLEMETRLGVDAIEAPGVPKVIVLFADKSPPPVNPFPAVIVRVVRGAPTSGPVYTSVGAVFHVRLNHRGSPITETAVSTDNLLLAV
mgnify:CR=1 FL=1